MASAFFKELTEFLPKYVSPSLSYLHAFVAFACIFTISYVASSKLSLDIDQDGQESESEEKSKKMVAAAISFIIGILAADLTYSVSWRLRNKAVNGNHLTWRRWFNSVYGM